jgi:tetratricopeptide (TPR) repeat protein
VLAKLYRDLPDADFTYTAGSMLSQLFTTVSNTRCRDVTAATVASLAESLRSNRRYRGDPLYNQFHHKLLAGIRRYEGDYEATVASLETAIALRPSPELNMMMVTLLGGAGQFDAARAFIDEALDAAPRNPLRAMAWRRNLRNLREYVAELERYSQRESQADPRTENDES